MTEPPLCAPPLPACSAPKNALPAGACDCHFHVFAPPSGQVPGRSYTAAPAPLSAYRALQTTLGLSRSVIVQPSVYGTDNRTMLEAQVGDPNMRAVVVVDAGTPVSELQRMAKLGAVGARANLLFSSGAEVEDLDRLTRHFADLGWHLQVLADVARLPDLENLINRLPVPVVFDHMGHVPAGAALSEPRFKTLLKLLERDKVWVKLSGAYRVAPDDWTQASPMARALIEANPERLVWGTDWPHPALPGDVPDDGALADLLFDWAGPELSNQILVTNPEQLYGFEPWDLENDA
ncbi:MAG: amidohydrolase family protein [Litoreibacter sp.]|nr:amidohydrolase family protein [Litoreibacter sp.]